MMEKIRVEEIKPIRGAGRFHFTGSWPSIFFVQLADTQFALDMKKYLNFFDDSSLSR